MPVKFIENVARVSAVGREVGFSAQNTNRLHNEQASTTEL